MGAVDFRYVVPPNQNVAVNFTDTFSAVAGKYLGPNWNCIACPANGVSGTEIDASLNVTGGNAVFGSGLAVNDNAARVLCIPNQVYGPRIQAISTTPNRGQFSQITLTTITAASGSLLVANYLQPNEDITHGYTLSISATSTSVDLNGRGVVFQAGVFNYALNDVIRLETRFTTSAINLQVFQNGVLRANVDDSNALRLSDGGLYGLIWPGAFGGQVGITQYSGGVI